jgi:Flp pilus assembly protein TadD
LFRDTYAWASIRSGSFLEEAIAILKSVLRDNETVGLYHYHLGEAYRKNGDKFEARKHLRRAIELEKPELAIAINAKKSLELVSQ